MPSGFDALIDYYLACLAKERRDDLTTREWELARSLLPVPGAAPTDWAELMASSAAQEAIARNTKRDNIAILFAPVIQVGAGGNRFEPVAGIFCTTRRGALHPDPADLWLGSALSAETDEAEQTAVRDELERTAATSPTAFLNATLSRMQAQMLPLPEVCADLDALKALPADTFAMFPAFWLVEAEASYDRGLVREMEQMKTVLRGGDWKKTAMRFFVHPPDPEPVTDIAAWEALQNPAALTFSQARALAACRQPLTVVTGPPGTGKTRLIVALIIEHLLTGRSLLLASRINMAVDSAVQLTERLLGPGAVLRTGNQEARQDLAQKATWLAGQTRWPGGGELFVTDAAGSASPVPSLVPLERGVTRLRKLARRLGDRGDVPLRWWQWLTRARLRRFEGEWEGLLKEAGSLFGALPTLRCERTRLLRDRLDALVAGAQSRLNRLANALEGDRRSRHRAFRHFAAMGFPVAVTNLTVSTNLPLEPGLFDTVVLDEASTCDPASLLPLLYRAKRAVIVGDDRQLPHITGKGWKQVEPVPVRRGADGEFAVEFGMSAFHLGCALVGDTCRFLLSDHFRCPPAIIAFSNEAFYGGALRIQTDERPDAVAMRLVDGKQRTTRTGSRMNDAQLTAGMEELARLARAAPEETLGLVTPYRALSDAALALAEKDACLADLLQKERLIIGTAHRFQGNEVDRLVFVTVAGGNAGERELRWVEHPQLFNVAVTRARRSLVIVADRALWERGALKMTRRLSQASAVMIAGDGAVPEGMLRGIADHLEVLHLPHLTGCSYRGYPLDVMEDRNPPGWAISAHTWESLRVLTVEEVLRLWSDEQALARRGLHVTHVNPLNATEAVMRWSAERELGEAMKGA